MESDCFCKWNVLSPNISLRSSVKYSFCTNALITHYFYKFLQQAGKLIIFTRAFTLTRGIF